MRILVSEFILLVSLFSIIGILSCNSQNKITIKTYNMNYKKLTPEESRVILNKGTEAPFIGEYTDNFEKGIYVCKQCEAPLYTSASKFHSGCGWPSFDDEIEGAIKKILDADGKRTEIVCAKCKGHLGHVFYGEGFTQKNTRHCVNSISMEFRAEVQSSKKSEVAIFAGGCFWGVEYYFQHEKGVLKTEVGYTGGHKENPTYHEVCNHTTGHIEVLRVEFDPSVTNFEHLAKLFFEIHNPTQTNGQGNDIGEQYLSKIFYTNESQKETSIKLIHILEEKGMKIATDLVPATKFWPAEIYHQQYYEKNGGTPYCHFRKNLF
jgi:peptide methionine sulfoxide reductase msrA/msrB